MIKVITKGDKYIGLLEVSKLAFYFDWNYCKKNYDNFNNPRIQIYWETEDDRVGGIITDFKSPEEFDIIGKLSQLDKELEEFVEKHPNINYRDYLCSSLLKAINGWTANWIYLTPKESFISLIKSQHPEFQEDKEYLLIKLL